MPNAPAPRRSTSEIKAGTEQRLMPYVSFDDLVTALPAILPTVIAVGAAAKWLLMRRDAKHQAELLAARKSRIAEREEMVRQREAFYLDIKSEVVRMRQLYESELDRGISLRTALAEAANREVHLQETILDLTRKVDCLQEEVAELRKELAARDSWAT
ncbi:hypothetical protein VQ042_11775 [Aurantimonas sp. A2-1-M11]|uniref:hypothetical protein n=1 Tax=Aurantimonas sp. A2-1-M11 TaxID=3113712 RepID=UPI002F9288BA